MNRRPNRETIEKMLMWLNEQGISLYASGADLSTGQQHHGCMDVTTTTEIIRIYELNKTKGWLETKL